MPSLTRLSTIGAVALTLFSSVRGSGAHDAAHSHVKRQASSAIVGAADHKVVPRLELRQLQADTDAYNLFMLAMQDFQNAPHDASPLSYFELSSIHGMPYQPYNGIQGADPNAQTGWCCHANPIFITWHRPYVVAWEQAMLDHAQTVVNKFSGADKERMQSALGRLRYPYVDFAVVPPSGSNSAVPTAMTDKTVSVNGPTGPQTIPNPLYSYNNFNPHKQGDFSGYGGGMWDQWPSTLRYPSSTSDVNAQSQEQQFIDAMNQNAAQIRAQLYRVLTACDNFLDISNDGAQHSNSNCNVDLESIHNGIHAIIGGGGHMTYNNWSAFDASFFLHHAFIDRIFAMWQKLHPEAWMPATNSGPGASYGVPANTALDGNYPLEPFRDASGTAYTSNSIRDIEKFYYTYPELADANLVETINNLYGANAKPENVQKPEIPASSSSSSKSSSSSSSQSSSSSPAPTSSSSSSNSAGSSSSSIAGNGKSNNLTPSKTSEIYSMLSSAFGPAATVLKNPEVSAAISSAMQAGATDAASFEKSMESAISSAVKSGATGIPGLESGIGGMMSSILGGSGSPNSVISSIMGNLGSLMGSGAQATPTAGLHPSGGLSGLHPSGGLSGLIPSGISGGAFPTATGGAFPSINGTLNGTSPANSGSSPTDRTQDYYCHFVAERGGLGTTFNVYGFLGEAPSGNNPLEWMSNKNYCGLWSNFAAMSKDKMSGHLVSGSIVLTHCLQQKVASGDLKSLDEKDVTPYLTKNLSWKTATGAGQQVENSQVPGLTVGSIAQKIMPASNLGSLPTYGQGNIVPAITNGKDGGYQKGMQYNWWDVCKAN